MQILRCTALAALLCATAFARPSVRSETRIRVQISVADHVLKGRRDGHIQLMFAPAGTDPLDDTDVTSSPNYFFGQNVFGLNTKSVITLSGGSKVNTDFGVYGFPNAS